MTKEKKPIASCACMHRLGNLPYYMKFSRHVYFAILMCAYFATLKFRIFEYNSLHFKGNVI